MAKKQQSMKHQKTKPFVHALSLKPIFASLLILCLWWVFWLASQSLYMVEVPLLTRWLLSAEPHVNFVILTIWILLVNLVALTVYHWLHRDYRFLKIKDKWDVLAYLMPLGLIILLLTTENTSFGVPILIYIIAMVVTNFCQELLTMGFMQTALSKYIGSVSAATVTCIMFYLGHFMISETLTYMGIIMVVGFILFSWLRFKRGNIYLANVVHLSWSLVMVLVF